MLISTGYECFNISHFIFNCVIAKLAHLLNVTAAHMDMDNFVFALCRLLTGENTGFFCKKTISPKLVYSCSTPHWMELWHHVFNYRFEHTVLQHYTRPSQGS